MGQWSAGQLRELVDRGPDVVPLALAVDVMNVGAGVADDLHAYFSGDFHGLHCRDERGAEAVETLLGLAAFTGGRALRVDAGLLHDLDELSADSGATAQVFAGEGGQDVVRGLGLLEESPLFEPILEGAVDRDLYPALPILAGLLLLEGDRGFSSEVEGFPA